ncbi:putative LRR receptor-like serine/threonine-protein kinase [Rosa sericea]
MDLSLLFLRLSKRKTIGRNKMLSFLRLRRKNNAIVSADWSHLRVDLLPVSYSALSEATDKFSSGNLIGVGSFGSVYKVALVPPFDRTYLFLAEYVQVHLVAVKVFNLSRHGASRSFITECEVLRNIRHRNVVKIVTACSSVDFYGNEFKALVYQYMEKGSLEEWLHPTSGTQQVRRAPKKLNLYQRLSIAIDVACAVEYLHNHCETPIVHCDIKPSNVLLDKEFTAHISDFGLARFLSRTKNDFAIGLRGSVGYAAPEYGMGGEVSTYGDLYSFGILLLEIFSGKKPTDEMFCDGSNFRSFCKAALSKGVTKIADPVLLQEGKWAASIIGIRDEEIEEGSSEFFRVFEKCLSEIFRIGIGCSTESPRDRLDIRDVVFSLRHIRERLPCLLRRGNVYL